MISTISTIDNSVPKHITTPIGIHRISPLKIIGSTPNAVVQEVKKIGLILLLPASAAASFTPYPNSNLKVSAYSNIRIPFLTTIPIRLTTPNTAVILKSRLKIQSPNVAPNRHRRLNTMVSRDNNIFLKWYRRKPKRIIMAHTRTIITSFARNVAK